jgi:hypothetical protein
MSVVCTSMAFISWSALGEPCSVVSCYNVINFFRNPKKNPEKNKPTTVLGKRNIYRYRNFRRVSRVVKKFISLFPCSGRWASRRSRLTLRSLSTGTSQAYLRMNCSCTNISRYDICVILWDNWTIYVKLYTTSILHQAVFRSCIILMEHYSRKSMRFTWLWPEQVEFHTGTH